MKKIAQYIGLLIVVAGVSAGTSYFVSNKKIAHEAASADSLNAHKWLHEADLTSDQLAKLEPHEKALKRDLDSLQIVLAKERIALCTLIKDQKPSPSVIHDHVMRIAQLETAQQEAVVNHLTVMAEVLTPEQKEKFFDAMMHDICTGCRNGFCKPGTPCMCGHCDMGQAKRT